MGPSEQACWRIATAESVAVIIDAADYFTAAREAFITARRRIMLVGWDFDARIRLSGNERPDDEPATIGEFLYWLVERNPDLELYLLRWDVGAFKTIFRGTTVFTVAKWMRHPRIHTKLDGHHPTGSSHHQKIVSIDDCFAFCGGIDMTGDRWDTREHRDDEPGRKRPGGKPFGPWHDATTAMSGPVARALAEECHRRWERATGVTLEPLQVEESCWPPSLEPHAQGVEVCIARTHPEMPGQTPVWEIEALFLEQIARAKRILYCESQYFASRKIAEAIARRLDEPDGPEIVLINPQVAQGWLEPLAMDTARARLVAALRKRDVHRRLRIYHPFTTAGAPIYVHAKITIVDECELRVGSANMNNRSMRLDSECDVTIAVADNPDAKLDETIAGVRDGLVAEHLGVPVERVSALLAATGSMIETIEQLRGAGKTLEPYVIPDLSEVETWLADNEVLDPETPAELFEPIAGHKLLTGLTSRFRLWRR